MFGIYIHIPFCEKKCSYCDFYSIERTERLDAFVETLLTEIDLRTEASQKLPSSTSVFFGGGTPSLLPPDAIARIFEAISRRCEIAPDAEITMECNPGTITLQSLQGYRSAGVNRLSFGVQSFHEPELAFLERIHSPDEARTAVRLARAAGFGNVNIDLMFALPPQTPASWRETLREAVALETDHISAYSLIYEEGTPLFSMLSRGEVIPTNEESDAGMYAEAQEFLAKHGFIQYEVSNFAHAGRECRHNLTYWRGEEYLAFGPSAHGYLDSTRYWNYRNLARYSEAVKRGALPVANNEQLGRAEQMFERAFLELRAQGIRLEEFTRDFGVDVSAALGAEGAMWREKGLAELRGGRLSLTAAGYGLCDELTLRMITALESKTGNSWEQTAACREAVDDPIEITLD